MSICVLSYASCNNLSKIKLIIALLKCVYQFSLVSQTSDAAHGPLIKNIFYYKKLIREPNINNQTQKKTSVLRPNRLKHFFYSKSSLICISKSQGSITEQLFMQNCMIKTSQIDLATSIDKLDQF